MTGSHFLLFNPINSKINQKKIYDKQFKVLIIYEYDINFFKYRNLA